MQQLVFQRNLCSMKKYIFVSQLFQILLFILLVIYTSHGDTFHHMGERKSHISFKHERLLRTLQLTNSVYTNTTAYIVCNVKELSRKKFAQQFWYISTCKNVFKRMTLNYVQFLLSFYKYLKDKDIQNLKKSYENPLIKMLISIHFIRITSKLRLYGSKSF